jgi:hypothetical protein
MLASARIAGSEMSISPTTTTIISPSARRPATPTDSCSE